MNDDARRAREFTLALADDLVNAAPDALIGVYLHGSAVLGDWAPSTSDVDVLVVATEAPWPSIARRLAAVLSSDRGCPGVGLEASVVRASAAAAPAAPWPFVVHVNTTPHRPGIVWGHSPGGDPDLILHYLVTRSFGWTAMGPPPDTVIGSIPHSVIVDQLANELRWAVDHASQPYAILNACRALRTSG